MTVSAGWSIEPGPLLSARATGAEKEAYETRRLRLEDGAPEREGGGREGETGESLVLTGRRGGGGGEGRERETETVFIPAVEVGQVYGRREREAGRAGEEGR